MTASQVLIAHTVKILVLLTLAGILVRRRWSSCWSFTAYLAVVLICNSLVSFWPEHFYQPWFYLARTAVYDGLKVAIAIELAYRTFQAFPGPPTRTRRVLFLLVLAISGILTLWDACYREALLEWEPRILTATIWLLFGLAVVVIGYRVPIHAYNKAILLGFVPYLLVFTLLLRMLNHYGWEILPLVQAADPAAYLLLMGWWAWAAWKPSPARSGSDRGSANRNSPGLSSRCETAPSIPAPFGCPYSERYSYTSLHLRGLTFTSAAGGAPCRTGTRAADRV